ncbi:hypothetical protein Tco_0156517 [Tanacetum coccineum]
MRFQQRFDESFYEAWDRFNDLLRACPHHGYLELQQLDTNSNNDLELERSRLILTPPAGGNYLDKKSLENAYKSSRASPKFRQFTKQGHVFQKNSQAPATVKAVEESCVTCCGAHSHRNCPATDGNVYRDNIQEYMSQAAAVNYNQGNTGYRSPMVVNQV